jgi:hypothetical protein
MKQKNTILSLSLMLIALPLVWSGCIGFVGGGGYGGGWYHDGGWVDGGGRGGFGGGAYVHPGGFGRR